MGNTTFVQLLREKAGKSQSEMARDMGWSLDFYRDVESGRRSFSLASAEKAAGALDMEPLALMIGHYVYSAEKSLARGEDTPEILRKAAYLCELAEKAEGEGEKSILLDAASELTRLVQSATATKSADLDDDVDPFGKKVNKRFSTQRTLATAEKSARTDNLDDLDDVDLSGRKRVKLFNTRPN